VQCVSGWDVQERDRDSSVPTVSITLRGLSRKRLVYLLGRIPGRGWGCVHGVLGGELQGHGGVGDLHGVPFELELCIGE